MLQDVRCGAEGQAGEIGAVVAGVGVPGERVGVGVEGAGALAEGGDGREGAVEAAVLGLRVG